MFAVRIEVVDRVAVCRPTGELDMESAPALREAMAALAAFPSVVIDFSGVPFIDSAGLGALIAGARRVRESGGDIVLCAPRKGIARLLTTAGMDRVLRVVDTLPEAVATFRTRAPA